MDLIEWSRLQFAITGMYHFLFVPLTLGMVWILVIMESMYVITNQVIYKDMTRFWGKLFGINFALGVTTGITMEFEFGTNWAYYSHYVGDIFGAPLAIEGLMAFFLESTMVGLFFFGWDRLSKVTHLFVTILVAVGTNLSALWILVANAWMQNPVGAEFSHETMRMELTDFWGVVLSHDAQNKFVHTVSAGYTTAAMFVMGISSWYLLKKQDVLFAKKSFRVAAAFGFSAVCSVIILGDESGYSVTQGQKTKLASLEAMWHTEPAPAAFNMIAWPNEEKMQNDWEIQIPWLMGLIGTRSISEEIPGINDIISENEQRIRSGIYALKAVETLRKNKDDVAAKETLEKHKADLGFGMLLKTYVDDVSTATEADIKRAARDTVPKVAPMFWSFRLMVALGFTMLAIFGIALYYSLKGIFHEKTWLLRVALYSIPMPWLAAELGWFVAEYGRQPWTVYGVLPTGLSVSDLSVTSLQGSLLGFIAFYTFLLIIEMYLMFRFSRQGPGSLGTGRYQNEHH